MGEPTARTFPRWPRWFRARGQIGRAALAGVLLVLLPALSRSEPPALPAAEADKSTPVTEHVAPGVGAAGDDVVIFAVDVQPIFAAHCVKCHGPDIQSSGLRLDARTHAEAGGYTGAPIIGGTLETNEVYRRVSSTERAYRMPKNSPALSSEQIETIRRWVAQGAVWSAQESDKASADRRSLYEQWVERLADWFQRHEFEYAYVQPYALAFLLGQLLLLALSRAKLARKQDRRWASGRFGTFACRFTGRELTLVWLCMLGMLGIMLLRGHQLHTDEQLATLQAANAKHQNPWSKTIYGYPPVPVRPDHPIQVAGTYYRGNCERNPELFNKGHYLTATFRIHLCDAAGNVIGVGDPVPADGLFVYCEIERAPGTPDMLFDSRMMATVFFSEQFIDHQRDEPLPEKPTPLLAIEDGQRWAARIPIRKQPQGNSLSGLIYLYMGKSVDQRIQGDASYAIKYDLFIIDQRLDADSDLWMSSFSGPSIAEPVPAGKLPFDEWFDHRPIPAITGQNTKDPKLLGVDEYIDKGLLPPDAVPQPKP
ncbi:MAG: c-type cytochrome domain-containing protein [Pirellulales bacterium]